MGEAPIIEGLGKLSTEEVGMALAFERSVWCRWAAKEITTDEACAALQEYMDNLRQQSKSAGVKP